MVKIGIMTFHWAVNHGALLQTYALQKALSDLIPESHVVVVDYKPARYDLSLKKAIRCRNPKMILRNLRDLKKEKLLAPFRDGLAKTQRYYSVEQLMQEPPNSDIFVAGSDQIWNAFYTMSGEGKPTAAYYLPFAPEATHISYAASFGTTTLKPEMAKYILPYLQKLDAISVREQTGKAILEQMGIPCQVVCDPSALIGQDAYCSLAQPAFSGKYTAKYFLRGESPRAMEAIRSFKKRDRVYDVSLLPMEKWLGGIRGAEFLLTNSFHGMMVALKLHVPFAVFLTEGNLSGMNDRFYTLLNMLELSNRIVSDDNPAEQIRQQPICWEQVDRLLDAYAMKSIAFLKEHCMLNQ